MGLTLPLLVAAATLPGDWRADLGIPVATDQGTLFLYGDTIHDGRLTRNTAVIGDTVITPALADTDHDTWYWPTDAIQLADGRLFVVALEMHEGGYLGYDTTDADAFVVTDPTNPASWRLARKLEDGPWGDRQVQFSDQYPFAFVRAPHGLGTDLYTFDDPASEWTEIPADLPESHGVFAPVQTDDGWWGYTWEMWHTHTLWHADQLPGPWTEVATYTAELRTYDHGLNVVDGHVEHRWSNGEADQRPQHQPWEAP